MTHKRKKHIVNPLTSAKLLIHDYGGYPFPVQLGREFAAREYQVLRLYCSSFNQAKGNLVRNGHDPDNFFVAMIDLGEPVKSIPSSKGGARRGAMAHF